MKIRKNSGIFEMEDGTLIQEGKDNFKIPKRKRKLETLKPMLRRLKSSEKSAWGEEKGCKFAKKKS